MKQIINLKEGDKVEVCIEGKEAWVIGRYLCERYCLVEEIGNDTKVHWVVRKYVNIRERQSNKQKDNYDKTDLIQ